MTPPERPTPTSQPSDLSSNDAARDGLSTFLLETVAAEIESFVSVSGWDGPAVLFALVPTRVLAADPGAADFLGTTAGADIPETALTPIAQDELPDGGLDEVLAQIGWPDEVVGCAVSQHIVILPPSAEDELDELTPEQAAIHPERREARLVAAVLRDGTSATILRLRAAHPGDDDELLTGASLAPNLITALAATLTD